MTTATVDIATDIRPFQVTAAAEALADLKGPCHFERGRNEKGNP